jgi:hypothetical protein
VSKRHREQLKQVTIVGQEPIEVPSAQAEPVKAKISFDQWWLQTQNMKNLRPELKTAVYKHFESRGYLDNENFDAGLKDFGVKA